MPYLLDTDWAVWFLRGRDEIVALNVGATLKCRQDEGFRARYNLFTYVCSP